VTANGTSAVAGLLAAMPMVDHHCHGVVTAELDRAGFEAMLSEGGPPPPGCTNFDSPVGLAVRRHCAPVLDLAPHASADDYVARRGELRTEATDRLLRGAGLGSILVDTGFRTDTLLDPAQMAESADTDAYEIVRLESVAEQLAADGVDASAFATVFPEALARTVRERGAVGVKSVAAYRTGFDLDPSPPSPTEVESAAAAWLATSPDRLADPVLERLLMWCAVELGLPIQFHVGFGDTDIRLHRTNPALLTDWLHAVPARVPVMLLHCYPFMREASYLTHVFPQVHVDVGLTITFAGPAGAAAILAASLELTPFTKTLFSSDAFGLAELYYLGTLVFRRALSGLLDDRVGSGEWTEADALRVARLVGVDNARRVYGLGVR
jgi:predicted TIM-barrel fold metal-dependent hydrolase